MMSRDWLQFKRNRLPQWRLEEGVYFITWCLQDRADCLSGPERTIVADALRHFNGTRYRLVVYVVMDDHVHAVLQTSSGHDLSSILHSLKSFTANRINRMRGRTGRLWQKDSHTEIMRNRAAIASRIQYVYYNPLRKWGRDSRYEWVEYFG